MGFSLAKLTRPNTSNVLLRDRLFSLLDSFNDRPLVWVTAPGGAGKTTLISSYIEKSGLNDIWYQVDEGDADVATFFHYFSQAVKNSTHSRKKLPVLTPEFQSGVPEFTRTYFREVFSDLPQSSILVFDNFQDTGLEAELLNLLPIAIQELPKGIRVVIVSRAEPPESFARLRANQQLAELTWSDLQFTIDEELAITRQRYPDRQISRQQLQKLNSKIKGWVTGLILLLEQRADLNEIEFNTENDSQEHLFEYFALEIFNRVSGELQDFLIKTSLLPHMKPSTCKKLSGNNQARKILSELAKKQYFTVRHGFLKTSYEYHPLFRDFLLSKAEGMFGQDHLNELRNWAGSLLAEEGNIDYAASIFQKTGHWYALSELIVNHADTEIKHGKNQQIERWIESLPTELVNENAWLLYWLGMAKLFLIPKEAYLHFKSAYDIFFKNKESKGIYLAWIGMASSIIFGGDDYKEGVGLIEMHKELQSLGFKVSGSSIRIKYAFCMFVLILYSDPDNEEFYKWEKEVEKLYRYIPFREEKIMIGTHLILYYQLYGKNISVINTANQIWKYVGNEDISPSYRLLICIAQSWRLWSSGKTDNVDKVLEITDDIQNKYGVLSLHFWAYASLAHVVFTRNNTMQFDKIMNKASACLISTRRHDVCHHEYLISWRDRLLENYQTSLQHAQTSVQHTSDLHGYVYGYVYPKALIISLIDNNQLEKADTMLRGLEDEYSGNKYSMVNEYLLPLARAYLSLKQNNDAQFRNSMAIAIKHGMENNITHTGFWANSNMALLFAKCLSMDIGKEYIHETIKLRNILPPEGMLNNDNWPWPVKFHTLGRFKVIKDDNELKLSDKHQQFIKTIIALGGKDIHEDVLTDALWPDSEGDAAHQSFATTLHRIRKILGKDTLLLQHNHVSLNPTICWLDSWSADKTLDEIKNNELDTNEKATKLFSRLKEQYKGPIFNTTHGSARIEQFRDKFNQRVLAAIQKLSDALIHLDDYLNSIDCLQLGLEINGQSEQLYRKLMECHIALGNNAEAGQVYQQAKQTIEDELGLSLSHQTQALYQSIQAS